MNQLATLLSSAIPLKMHYIFCKTTAHNWDCTSGLAALIELIESGLPFSQSLKQGKYLNFQEIQLIQVGEMTGKTGGRYAPKLQNVERNH